MTLRAVLLDIEGTTTSISFVHDVLFPIARRALPDFVAAHLSDPAFAVELASLRSAVAADTGAPPAAVDAASISALLLRLVDEDRKDTALKSLQGAIWRASYERGEIASHVYPDVLPAFQRWRAAGLQLHVFSSGSTAAQRLLFEHTIAGDLTPHLGRYFDTTTGPKRAPDSYRTIARSIHCAETEVLFLSDTTAELDAARDAGLTTRQILRSDIADPASTHLTARSFDEILPSSRPHPDHA
jgi:enolase-phosphatase E1